MLLAPLLSACGPGYQDLSLPGSGMPGETYRLEAVFDDALNLSSGAQVKVNGLLVGRVQDVRAEGFRAVAGIDVRQDVELRQGSTARLRYDTPLGELFVQVVAAESGPVLDDGDRLSAKVTSTAPTVEDTLAQASLLINGGGLAQLQTINEELNAAIGGQEGTVRRTLRRSREFLAGANAGAEELDSVVRDLTATAKLLSARQGVFREALRALGPAARVLRNNTRPLVRLLDRTERLTTRANRTLSATQQELTRILTQLGPILAEIHSAEAAFVHGLTSVASADRRLRQAIPGDFMPVDSIIVVDLARLLGGLAGSDPGSDPGSPSIPGLPALSDLLPRGGTTR